jgi:hypothetical protein
LYVHAAGITKYVHEAGFVHLNIYALCREPDIAKQAAKFACRIWEVAELLDCEFIKR